MYVQRLHTYLGVDEWYNTSLRDDDITKELVQPTRRQQRASAKERKDSLLIVPDGKLQVTGNNTLLLVVARRVTRKLEDLGSKVLEYRREVDCTQDEPQVRTVEGGSDSPGAPAPTRCA